MSFGNHVVGSEGNDNRRGRTCDLLVEYDGSGVGRATNACVDDCFVPCTERTQFSTE